MIFIFNILYSINFSICSNFVDVFLKAFTAEKISILLSWYILPLTFIDNTNVLEESVCIGIVVEKLPYNLPECINGL